jgi:hypothetical protein
MSSGDQKPCRGCAKPIYKDCLIPHFNELKKTNPELFPEANDTEFNFDTRLPKFVFCCLCWFKTIYAYRKEEAKKAIAIARARARAEAKAAAESDPPDTRDAAATSNAEALRPEASRTNASRQLPSKTKVSKTKASKAKASNAKASKAKASNAKASKAKASNAKAFKAKASKEHERNHEDSDEVSDEDEEGFTESDEDYAPSDHNSSSSDGEGEAGNEIDTEGTDRARLEDRVNDVLSLNDTNKVDFAKKLTLTIANLSNRKDDYDFMKTITDTGRSTSPSNLTELAEVLAAALDNNQGQLEDCYLAIILTMVHTIPDASLEDTNKKNRNVWWSGNSDNDPHPVYLKVASSAHDKMYKEGNRKVHKRAHY